MKSKDNDAVKAVVMIISTEEAMLVKILALFFFLSKYITNLEITEIVCRLYCMYLRLDLFL